MKLWFSEEAGEELAEASAWYRERAKDLADEFRKSFEAAAKVVTEHPELYRVIYNSKRRAPLRRFPYFLLYQVVEDTVLVLGCVHFSREPKAWKWRGESRT